MNILFNTVKNMKSKQKQKYYLCIFRMFFIGFLVNNPNNIYKMQIGVSENNKFSNLHIRSLFFIIIFPIRFFNIKRISLKPQ